MSQKIPLFQGVIRDMAVAAAPGAVLDIFTPPDADSDAPNIYEVHLWVAPRLVNTGAPGNDPVATQVRAYEGPNAASAVSVWRALANANVRANPVAKALDGYPIRGDVTLDMLATAATGADPIFMWGYYRRVGEGPQIQPERRPIAQAPSTPFNAGVPFVVPTNGSQIIHVFEPNRIDEISLAAFFDSDDSDALVDNTLRLSFEDVNNNILSFYDFVPQTTNTYEAIGTAPDLKALPPNASLFPPSAYVIHQCPFGGGYLPTLHHIRAWNIQTQEGENPDAIFHGYFTRR